MFEPVTRVPLIVCGPGIDKNKRISELMQWMDIGLSILDLGKCTKPKMEAISFLPALFGKQWKGRDFVFCEQVGDMVLTEVDFMSMIRNKEWKLIHLLNPMRGNSTIRE